MVVAPLSVEGSGDVIAICGTAVKARTRTLVIATRPDAVLARAVITFKPFASGTSATLNE